MKTSQNAFKLIGLKLEGKTTNENNQSNKVCGLLWQQFESGNFREIIPGKLSDDIYAVYFDYEHQDKAVFFYFIGCRAEDTATAPAGLQALQIPGQHYEKYTAKGVMTGCITDQWMAIRESGIRRLFGFDFELYDQKSRDWSNAEVDICVSVVG